MAKLRNIVYLTEAQKVTLFQYGQYPYPSATPTIVYSDNDIYIVTQSWNVDGSASDYFKIKDSTGVARLELSSSGVLTAAGFAGSGALLTNLDASKLNGTIPSAVLGNSSFYIGMTQVPLNRASGEMALNGIFSISNNGDLGVTATSRLNLTGESVFLNADDLTTSGFLKRDASSGLLSMDTNSYSLSSHGHNGLLYRGTFTDFGVPLTEGTYYCGSGSSLTGAPYAGAIYGKLVVLVNDGTTHNNSYNWIWQYFDDTSGRRYYRYKVNTGAWTSWYQQYDALTTNIGTGATNYKAGNYAPSKSEIENVLTGVISTHSHSHTFGTTAGTFAEGNHAHTGVYEPIISTKNTAFNKNYGTSTSDVKMNGSVSVGSVDAIARIDHVHPVDTSRVAANTAITAGTATKITYDAKGLVTAGVSATLDDIADGSTRKLANYLPLSGGTMTGYITAPGYDYFKTSAISSPSSKYYTVDTNQIAQAPFGGVLWHDLLAFCRVATPTFEMSTDGTIFTSATLDKRLFAMKEYQSITIIDPASYKAARWTWTDMTWGLGAWLVLGHTWASGTPSTNIKVESSVNGSTWTVRHNSTVTAVSAPYWYYVSSYGSDNYLRLTITNNSADFIVRLSSIRLLTSRWGDQGRGKEGESPLDWDENRNISTPGTVTATTFIGALAGTATGNVVKNTAITGATKTKITYDSKGLVTAGADATLDDIADGGTRKLTNYLPLAGGTLVGALSIDSTLSFRAASTANTATQIPVFIADPASTTRTLYTRTPAQFRSDIGAGTGNGTVSTVVLSSGTNNGTLKLTVNGSTTDNVAVTGLGSAAYTASSAYRPSDWVPTWSEVTSKPTTFTPTAHTHYSADINSLDISKVYAPSWTFGVNQFLKPLFDITRADRTSFLPASQIIIEQSVDAGVTWTDAGISDDSKRGLFAGTRPSIGLPLIGGIKNVNAMLRITITGMKYNVPMGTPETAKYAYWNSTYVTETERYCTFDDCWMWVGSGPDYIWYKVEHASGADSNTWTNVREGWAAGWDGGNYAKLDGDVFGGGTSQIWNAWNWRFTFRTGSNQQDFVQEHLYGPDYTTYPQAVKHIKITGQNVWHIPNTMMYLDHLYGWDIYQNALFPALVQATKFQSTVATGVAPFTVNSTTIVDNLNADLLDGNHAAAFAVTGHNHDSAYSALSHTHSTLDHIDGPRNLTNRLPTWSSRSTTFDFVNAGIVGGTGNYGGVMTFVPWEGTTSSTGDSSYQLAFANLTGVNASGIPALKIRNGIDSTWNAWHTFYHTGNKPTATDVGLGNVTNESKATMFTSPTFTGTVANFSVGTISGNITGNAGSATYVTTSQKSDDINYQIPFVTNTTASTQSLYTDSAANITYNPSTNTLTTTTFAGALSGNATTATTLATGRTFTVTDNDGTNSQAASTTFNGSADYTVKLPATIKATLSGNASSSTNASNLSSTEYSYANTGTQYLGLFSSTSGYQAAKVCPSVYLTFNGTSTGLSLTVPKFIGDLTGNVTGNVTGTATNANNVNIATAIDPASGQVNTYNLLLASSTGNQAVKRRTDVYLEVENDGIDTFTTVFLPNLSVSGAINGTAYLTSSSTASTASAGDNDTSIATTAFVNNEIDYRNGAQIGTDITGNTNLIYSSHRNKFIRVNSSSAITLTVNSGTALNTGDEIHICKFGTGEVSFVASGVTIYSEGSKLKINAQYQVATLKCIASNTYVLFGALKS